MDGNELAGELRQFTGTTQWYKNPLYPWLAYTDGVKHFAGRAGAYWFLDVIGTELHELAENEGFIHLRMHVHDSSAEIVAGDGNGSYELYAKDIPFTDCPEGIWEFYLIDFVLLLPSEY